MRPAWRNNPNHQSAVPRLPRPNLTAALRLRLSPVPPSQNNPSIGKTEKTNWLQGHLRLKRKLSASPVINAARLHSNLHPASASIRVKGYRDTGGYSPHHHLAIALTLARLA